jgi:hypothetical protein
MLLEKQARADHVSFHQAVNNTLRAGLSMTVSKKNPPVTIRVHSSKLAPGINPNVNFNHLADDLETAEFIKKFHVA